MMSPLVKQNQSMPRAAASAPSTFEQLRHQRLPYAAAAGDAVGGRAQGRQGLDTGDVVRIRFELKVDDGNAAKRCQRSNARCLPAHPIRSCGEGVGANEESRCGHEMV